jgi:hypothetical protein
LNNYGVDLNISHTLQVGGTNVNIHLDSNLDTARRLMNLPLRGHVFVKEERHSQYKLPKLSCIELSKAGFESNETETQIRKKSSQNL